MGSEKFILGELFGFFLLVIGTLVYNEIIEIPIDFMNKNTKQNILKREADDQFRKKDLENIGIDQLDTGSNSNAYSESQRLLASRENAMKNKMA